MTTPEAQTLYLVSDSTGRTCNSLAEAVLVQFDRRNCQVVQKNRIRTVPQVRKVVKEAAGANALIFYTLVSPKARDAMKRFCNELQVPRVDIFGRPLTALNDLLKTAPRAKPGLLYASDPLQFDRLDAIDYTLKHDDGQRPQELGEADVVLVGVSRASKSSTCFFLAYEGIRAANVPLVPNVPPHPRLLEVDPEKVIGLTVNAMRLRTVREVRAKSLDRKNLTDYLDKRMVAHEVIGAKKTMDEHGWRSFDTSYMAIEEIAKEVIRLRGFEKRR